MNLGFSGPMALHDAVVEKFRDEIAVDGLGLYRPTTLNEFFEIVEDIAIDY